jgi:hypothetical protein
MVLKSIGDDLVGSKEWLAEMRSQHGRLPKVKGFDDCGKLFAIARVKFSNGLFDSLNESVLSSGWRCIY